MSFNDKGERTCDACGAVMKYYGFVVENGYSHYCCEECLHKHYTEAEWVDMYDDGYGDSHWAEWYDEDN